jgi:hypothetical protein
MNRRYTGLAIKTYIDDLPIAKTITKLAMTGQIPSGSTYSTTSGGPNYTKSGADGYILSDAAEFNTSPESSIYLNGVYLVKGTEVVWLSSVSFELNLTVDNGDEIIILGGLI